MATPHAIALDSGALIALSRGHDRVRRWLRNAIRDGAMVQVPAPVLAETLRGGPQDVAVYRILNSISDEDELGVPLSARAARDAGERLGRTGYGPEKAIDAMIVACARANGADAILTQDPKDMRALAADLLVIEL